jgi:hypothetical protein
MAAAYVGVGTTLFDLLVKDGRMPRPKRVNSRRLWDRQELDLAISELPHDDEGSVVSDDWGEPAA